MNIVKKQLNTLILLISQQKKRLKGAIEKLPFGDIKKLQGVENGYRLRVGDLRVLFTPENDIIFIDNIIPRGQAYKKI